MSDEGQAQKVRFMSYLAMHMGKWLPTRENFPWQMYNKGCFALSIYRKEVFVTISSNAYGYEWRERYNIIKGICEGLSYLHKNHIVTST